MNYKCETYDIIIAFLKSHKNKDYAHPYIESFYKGKNVSIWNTHYLLGQILRQFNIPEERYFISEKSLNKWKEITNKNIRDFYYREKVVCENDNVEIEEFKGASKKGITRIINKGDTFIFRDVFHLEHMIPIKVIEDELLSLKDDELDYDHVDSILNKLYICRILKTEDRKIENKYKRSSDIEDIIKNVYRNIKVIR